MRVKGKFVSGFMLYPSLCIMSAIWDVHHMHYIEDNFINDLKDMKTTTLKCNVPHCLQAQNGLQTNCFL